ncbi:MAG: hypothetical protein ACREHF_02080 [Rhizomicrobium sp.]
MSALTEDRDTKERHGDFVSLPVKAATLIYAGALVCLDSTSHAVPGATATTLISYGRAEAQADNSAGADAAINVRVRRGVFRFDNSASGDLITMQHVGTDCYVVDDHTVAHTSGTSTRSVAGKVFDVDAEGVWVDTRVPGV